MRNHPSERHGLLLMRMWRWAAVIALLVAGCSGGPTGRDLVAQAQPEGQISFDVVKIDDAVVKTLLTHGQASFADRFKKYSPPPSLKIGIGDTLAVLIFEAASNGLFGESLPEISLPPGAVERQLLSPETPPLGTTSSALQQLGPALDLSARLGGIPTLRSPATQPPSPFGTQEAPSILESGAPGHQGFGVPPQQGLSAGQQGLPNRSLAGQAAPGTLGETAANRDLQRVLEAAVQGGRSGTLVPDQQVGLDGGITIPYAGRINVAGRTPEEVQRIIEQRLADKAIQPQALVIVRRNLANSVSVVGEVVRGARVGLSPGGDRILQVLTAAGGLGSVAGAAQEIFVELSRDGITATVPYSTLVSNPDQNIFAEPGDVLTVLRRPQTFSVFGATGKNTVVTFSSEKLSLAEALGKSGGLLDDRADASAVFLFRYEPTSIVRALGQPPATRAPAGVSPIAYRLDLQDAESLLLAREFPVRDKDIIFIADAETRRLNQFFAGLSQIVGAVITGAVTCNAASC